MFYPLAYTSQAIQHTTYYSHQYLLDYLKTQIY